MAKAGWLLDAFTLHREGEAPIEAEIRLIRTPGGGEFLWHYENGRHVLAHPAKRCNGCDEVITSSHVGGACLACVDGPGLNLGDGPYYG